MTMFRAFNVTFWRSGMKRSRRVSFKSVGEPSSSLLLSYSRQASSSRLLGDKPIAHPASLRRRDDSKQGGGFKNIDGIGSGIRWSSGTSSSNSSSSSSSSSSTSKEQSSEDAQTHFGFKQVRSEDKEGMVKGVFNSVADSYDVMNDVMSGGLHRLWKDEFVGMLGCQEAVAVGARAPRLLDVAGGTGDIAFRVMEDMRPLIPEYMSREGVSGSGVRPLVTVSDINGSMLRVGEQRALKRFPSDVTDAMAFVEADAEKLPFADGSFDLYTIAFGMRNVTHMDNALKEAHRVLRRGGRFLCLEFSHVTNPVLANVYQQYSFNVIPQMGHVVADDREAYQYLVESIRMFPDQEAYKKRIEDAGFQGVSYRNMTFGVVAAHSGFKL